MGKRVKQPPTLGPPGVKIAEEKMQKLLQVAIASSQSLKWNIGRHDSKWTPTAVVDAIKTLPSVKSLDLVLLGRRYLARLLDSESEGEDEYGV
ncbi:hypothetical protein K443DRAFT_679066 [Laccaria amethystina LaAM-08-1]|uniref:Uncharacterized protein n=1 Tax=Laccaria amethystina LaAM-08-1 TaxID=1095629 RepID=A0A0C9XXL9_9AGAR|nr:hypothetical protein K443DRAFT_679066 [Laccaria amethystina LaAM-08-1]